MDCRDTPQLGTILPTTSTGQFDCRKSGRQAISRWKAAEIEYSAAETGLAR
jgi:hypothetical protein